MFVPSPISIRAFLFFAVSHAYSKTLAPFPTKIFFPTPAILARKETNPSPRGLHGSNLESFIEIDSHTGNIPTEYGKMLAMARHMSQKYLHSLKFPRIPTIHARLFFRPIIVLWRKTLRKTLPAPQFPHTELSPMIVSEAFDAGAETFRRNHWAFVESFLAPEFREKILVQWPKRRYFNPAATLAKSYDIGLIWIRNRSRRDRPEFLELFPSFLNLFDFLQSEIFANRVTKFIGSPHPLSLFTFMINKTYRGSTVVPHHDDSLPERALPFVNVIIFINGSGGTGSGGLVLAKDNDLKEIIFEPENLKNTALIYDISEDFYHGFPPVQCGKFRLAITASFCRKDYDGVHEKAE